MISLRSPGTINICVNVTGDVNNPFYLHVAEENNRNKCSPLDKLKGLKVIGSLQCELNFD